MEKEFTATAKVVLTLPRAEVWRRMQDLTRAKYYVPGLLECRLTTEQTTGMGASRKVFMERMVMDETVIEWTEGSGFVLRLHNGDRPPMIFARATARYSIEDSPGDRTLFVHSLTYVMRGGFFGAMLARLWFNRVMKTSAVNVAQNLKQYYETELPSNQSYRPTNSV